MSWFIDSIDRRAGVAFAVQARGDRYRDDEERAICFIEPPDFEPRPIASRALALGASKHGAEAGMLVDGAPVVFDSLSDIVEFVRRAYGASGGGDGSGEDGPPPTPEGSGPEEPGGEGPGPIEGFEEGERGESRGPRMIVARLLGLLNEAQNLTGGRAYRLDWSELSDGGGETSLARPASLVINALLMRVTEDSAEMSMSWRASFTRLCSALALIGFLPDFAIERLARRGDVPVAQHLRDYLHWRYEYRPLWRNVAAPTELAFTPFDMLCALPVPPPLRRLTPRPFEHLGEFLAFACASSDWVRSPQALEIAEMVWFCAAVVTAAPFAPQAFPFELDDRRLLIYRRDQARKAAAHWLAQNLPQAVFAPALERLITRASRDRAPI